MGKSIYNKKVVETYLNDEVDKFKEYLDKRDPVALVLDAIEKGNFNRDAARLANISESEFYLWLQEKISLDKINPYFKSEFSEAVSRAKAKRTDFHVSKIREASNKDWKASAWMLEKLEPKVYGKTTQIGFTNNHSVRSVSELTPEEQEKLQKKIDAFLAHPNCLEICKEWSKEELERIEKEESQQY